MDTSKYGSRAWIESQYATSEEDPWGLNWRPSQQYRYVRMIDALKAELGAQAGELAIVDVGCATGAFTAMLGGLHRDAGKGSLVGVDIAESAVTRAALRFPQVRFECLALDECTQKYAGTATLVTCMEVLYYLPAAQRQEAVRQLKSMLKPGGLLLVSSMVSSAPYFSAGELKTLIAGELRVVGTGVLYMKPLVLFEKLLMKLRGKSARKGMNFKYATVDRLGRYFGRFLPGLARSHAYVIARKD